MMWIQCRGDRQLDDMSVALLLYLCERRSVNIECLKLGHASNFLYSLAVAVVSEQTLCLVPVVRCHQQSH